MKREEWLEHFEKQSETGISVNAYCRREGLKASAWYYWRGRLKAESVGVQRSFVQARLVETHVGSCEVVFPSGVRIKLEEMPPISWLRSLAL